LEALAGQLADPTDLEFRWGPPRRSRRPGRRRRRSAGPQATLGVPPSRPVKSGS